MRWVIIAMFALSSFLLFTAVLGLAFLSDRRMNKRLKRFLELNDKQRLGRKSFNLLVQLRMSKQAVREKVLTKKKNERLADMLSRAGVPLKPEEYILFQWICMALCAGLAVLLFGRLPFLLLGAAAGGLVPRLWVRRKERKRIASFNDGLLDMLTTIIGSLRAGFSFVQALKTVVEETQGPVQEEAEIVLKEMQYGTSMEDALQAWKERMPSEDLNLMIQAILIQRQIGGNLAVILDTIVQTIRDRGRIQRQVTTLTAQGRLSGLVIGLLPFVLALILYMIQPSYISTLFHHPIGYAMIAGGLVSGSIGFYLIKKITTIEV